MKLPANQTDEASLLCLGKEAVSLLEKRDFRSLADRFDYALKFGRSPFAAIESDFQACLAEFHALLEQPMAVPALITVKYFEPNNLNLFAVVECVFIAAEGCPILAELIISSSAGDKYVTLEQISLVTA